MSAKSSQGGNGFGARLHRTGRLTLIATAFAGAAAALDCGDENEPCKVAGGEYYLALPEGWSSGPAILHLHGYGSSGLRVIRNAGFVGSFTARGYAVIAPSALPWFADKPSDWAVRDGWVSYPRDDVIFLREVLADAVARAGIAPDRVVLTGFSRGGSMVWDVACRTPDLAAAYAAAAGGFWLPLSTKCAGPVDLLHTHGFADSVVPLEGRSIRNDEFEITITQADIWQGLQIWRELNGCPSEASAHEIREDIWRKGWACKHGHLELILHKGGHGLPRDWANLVVDWFENLER